MGKVATILENGTDAHCEVKSRSTSGVHILVKKLAPREQYTLERRTSDTYLQHWVFVGAEAVASFSSDELIDNEKIVIEHDGTEFKVALNPRATMMKSSKSMPIPGRSSFQSNNDIGKPPLHTRLGRLLNSLIRRSQHPTTLDASSSDVEPHMRNSHAPSRLHSI